ncbi:acyl-CoA dehydrogenase [Trebonia kvetii]|uniref:Medium-chain specific acyl-CoA dehydrogenase, mitochondrial n=1 Tax=Trebonia kvetii TaxID=2480626 RepID=A0A6P2BVT0_9ACTN|nr:acyl-CoA dehydrogenase family protein [Trebonia kvetii]TVZ03010.1 acyl-CoA dehydrogenase [Trebonia kvetii]
MYGLSAADEDIQARARAFADELIPFEVQAELDGGLPDDVTQAHKKRAMELGVYATNMPRELGGIGASSLQQVLVQEQVGRVTNALGWVAATPPSWLPPVATEDQLERYLKPTVRGEREECYAITEEGAGSDVDAIEATAYRDGADWVLNGVKWHVTSYNTADYAFFQAKKTDDPERVRPAPDADHLLFLVDLPSHGVSVVRTPAYSHTISHHHPIVAFENVRVPAANLVGGEGDGMLYSREWFRFERLMVAARCTGAAERLVAEMTAFATTRVAGGARIADHGLVAGMLADSVTELFAARSLLYETARGIDRDPADTRTAHAQCSMAKLYCSEMAGRVADRAVQVFGGRGYMRENVAERFFRELRVERIWEGTSEIQRMIIARQLANRGVTALA